MGYGWLLYLYVSIHFFGPIQKLLQALSRPVTPLQRMKIGRLRISPSASHSLYFGTTEGEVGWLLRNLEGEDLDICKQQHLARSPNLQFSCPLGKTPTAWYIGPSDHRTSPQASALAVADFLPDLHFRNMEWLHFQWGLAGLSRIFMASAELWHLTDPLVQ